MLESIGDPSKIVFLIEGKKVQNKFSRITTNTLNSAILNLIFKPRNDTGFNFKVIITDSIQDTLDNILLLYKKVKNGELTNEELTNSKQIIQLPEKLIKKSDNDSKYIFINQLGIISGVSINIATKIKEKYNCMAELINTYNTLDEINCKKLLANLQVTEKRKLGLALSTKIYLALTS
jgi:ERCC4-type nuclease